MTITKEDIIKITGEASLQNILKLDLSNKDLERVDIALLNQLTKLEELSLADNRLRTVKGLCLPQLRRLDLANNLIMDFHVGKLDQLEELVICGNPLNLADQYIAMDQIPSLKKIDKKSCQALCQTIQRIQERIQPQVESIWTSQFAPRLNTNFTDDEAASVMTNFARQLKQSLFLPEVPNKYKLYKVHAYAKKMIDQKYKERAPTAKLVDVGPVIHRISKSGISTPIKSLPSSPAKASPKKRKALSPAENGSAVKALKLTEETNGTPSAQLEPAHLLRCHSNSPSDHNTQVWAAAFDPQDPDLVATCGADTICFISCCSGKVVQKYQHRVSAESLYCLAWTQLGSILATGGKAKSIHLLSPQQGICYKSFLAHQDALNCLLFDPCCPTLLYSGSEDKKIHLWDIGQPTASNCGEVTVKKKLTFNARMPVLRLALSPTEQPHRLLMAAGEGKLLGWNISKLNKEPAVITFELPWVHSSPLVDGLFFLSPTLLCCKESQSGKLLVWSLPSTMEGYSGGKAALPCSVTCQLDWKADCRVDFIYPAGHPGSRTVYCGDDCGQVWVYQLSEDTLTSTKSVLEWPGEDSYKKSGGVLVNNIAVSEDGCHVVVCTNRNLVAIWSKD